MIQEQLLEKQEVKEYTWRKKKKKEIEQKERFDKTKRRFDTVSILVEEMKKKKGIKMVYEHQLRYIRT